MILLDTCTIIWEALTPKQLSAKAKAAIEKGNEEGAIYFAQISLWEIAMLIHKKRIQISCDYQTFIKLILDAKSYRLVGINPTIAERAATFPNSINADPADRLIAATAVELDIPLVTADQNLQKSHLFKTIW